MMATSNGNLIETQRRLLEAAGEVFAEMGFNSARIRDICKRADANVAAVNYHFAIKKICIARPFVTRTFARAKPISRSM